MTIWAHRPYRNGQSCTVIEHKGYQISIAMDDGRGAHTNYMRSDIRIFTMGEDSKDVTDDFLHCGLEGATMLYGNFETLFAIMKELDSRV